MLHEKRFAAEVQKTERNRNGIQEWMLARSLILGMLCVALAVPAQAAPPVYPEVRPGYHLQFPRDFGAHPDYRTEWWYVTGWLTTEDGKALGFQVTFFRSRLNIDEANPSRFAPKQLIFAHAAIADPATGHLLHDQRAARAGFGLARADAGDTRVQLDDWHLTRANEAYTTHIRSREFSLDLTLTPAQPVLMQGDAGYSRKGALSGEASHYYSQPQVRVSGTVTRLGKAQSVRGTAWLDHEWSSSYLAKNATGWDWTGINLDDGSALMLFRIRGKDGGKQWAGGTLRRADGSVTTYAPDAIAFTPLRRWRSPRTNTEYPVAMQIAVADMTITLEPLMNDQELDSRASTGAVYWEGAVTATRDGKAIGHGYLELTGYFKPLKM